MYAKYLFPLAWYMTLILGFSRSLGADAKTDMSTPD